MMFKSGMKNVINVPWFIEMTFIFMQKKQGKSRFQVHIKIKVSSAVQCSLDLNEEEYSYN